MTGGRGAGRFARGGGFGGCESEECDGGAALPLATATTASISENADVRFRGLSTEVTFLNAASSGAALSPAALAVVPPAAPGDGTGATPGVGAGGNVGSGI